VPRPSERLCRPSWCGYSLYWYSVCWLTSMTVPLGCRWRTAPNWWALTQVVICIGKSRDTSLLTYGLLFDSCSNKVRLCVRLLPANGGWIDYYDLFFCFCSKFVSKIRIAWTITSLCWINSEALHFQVPSTVRISRFLSTVRQPSTKKSPLIEINVDWERFSFHFKLRSSNP